MFSYDDDPYYIAPRERSRLTITGTTINNNRAGQHGGGIAICAKRGDLSSVNDNSGAQVRITNSTISDNQAGNTGPNQEGDQMGGDLNNDNVVNQFDVDLEDKLLGIDLYLAN